MNGMNGTVVRRCRVWVHIRLVRDARRDVRAVQGKRVIESEGCTSGRDFPRRMNEGDTYRGAEWLMGSNGVMRM